MQQSHRDIISSFEDVLIAKTDFKKVYTLLLRWEILPVTLKAFGDISKIKARSDKENNKILYKVIKTRGEHAYLKLIMALQISNPELANQVLGRPWKLSNENWSYQPQVYNLCNADILGSYRVVTFTEDRRGWEKEEENLRNTFQFLGYEGSESRDPTEKELDEIILEFTESKREAGCYVFVLSAHGGGLQGEEVIRLPDQSFKALTKILLKFCEAPALLGKPKIVILQYCRGKRDNHLDVTFSRTMISLSTEMPGVRDTIVLRACLPGYVAYRDTIKGGWFIHVLADKIKEFARTKDVEEIMIEVYRELVAMEQNETGFYETYQGSRFMTPCANAYSFKKFYFLPKEENSLQEGDQIPISEVMKN